MVDRLAATLLPQIALAGAQLLLARILRLHALPSYFTECRVDPLPPTPTCRRSDVIVVKAPHAMGYNSALRLKHAQPSWATVFEQTPDPLISSVVPSKPPATTENSASVCENPASNPAPGNPKPLSLRPPTLPPEPGTSGCRKHDTSCARG